MLVGSVEESSLNKFFLGNQVLRKYDLEA